MAELCTGEKLAPAGESLEAGSCRGAVAFDLAVAVPNHVLQLGRQSSVELLELQRIPLCLFELYHVQVEKAISMLQLRYFK